MTSAAKKTNPIRLAVASLAVGIVLSAALPVTAEQAQPVSPELTPKLRDLLRKEMLSVEDASHQIMSYLIAGDDDNVEQLAQKIHDSFILQQSMTPEDKQDLMAAVPEDFVTQDRAFHALSADLAEAARNGDRPAQHQKFGEMIQACSACHTQYATDRFPKLSE